MNRWIEYFEEFLNRAVPTDPSDNQPAEKDLDINCKKPPKRKLRKLSKSRRTKPAGPVGIPAEAITANTNTSVELLYKLASSI